MADSIPGSTATTVWLNAGGSVTAGTIDTTGDSDWYAITLTAGVLYQFDLAGASGDGTAYTLANPALVLRNSAGTSIASDDDTGLGANARIFYTPTTSGTYYLDAQSSGGSGTGTYAVIVNPSPVTGTIAPGGQTTGTLTYVGDTNLYSITLTSGTAYGIRVANGTLANPFVELLDASGSVLTSNDDYGGTRDAFLTYTATSTGTFYVAARASANGGTGAYTVSAWQLPTLTVSGSNVGEGDTGRSTCRFTLTLSAASPVPVTVQCATTDLTARAGVDYGSANASVTIAAGATTAYIDVPVYGNTSFQSDRFFRLSLSGVSNAVLGSTSAAYGRILDDDTPAGLTLPSDSLLHAEWYLWDIDVFRAWQDYNGSGVRVAVFDQGIDSTNPDLRANVATTDGRIAATLAAGGAPLLSADNHGTAVAGVIAADSNNYQCVGVAPSANLVPIYDPLAETTTVYAARVVNAFTYAKNCDVLNDSWGFGNLLMSGTNWAFVDDFASPTFLAAAAALKDLAGQGRGGLGTVVVQSAGNAYRYGDDTNLHNFQNSRYIITVAATDSRHQASSFSSPGASVLVAAPGGDGSGTPSDVLTTDRVGAAGYSTTDYTLEAGTSFSAPMVSGVVALMLDANPRLGYRDVQEILAYSARAVAADVNLWAYNGAHTWNGGGLHYDAIEHNLGFGLVDATAAVRLAETWISTAHTSANVKEVVASASPHAAIPDDGVSTGKGGAASTIAITQAMQVERVDVTLNVTHPWIGDLYVTLVSPAATMSLLVSRPGTGALSAYGSSQDNIHFTMDTVLNWGESSVGNWTLTVFDAATGSTGTFDSWTLDLIGKPSSSDDAYVYTDEYRDAVSTNASRATLTDTGGADVLNAAAITSDSIINLVPGATSTLAGAPLTLAAGTIIEAAIGGDGNDRMLAGATGSTLRGMRGNDTLVGGTGKDTLEGGAGNDSLTGGDGLDTAVYSGTRAQTTITALTDGGLQSAGPDGTDVLHGVERLVFSDAALAFDLGGTGGQAYRLYQAAYDRTPDVGGLGFWIHYLDIGFDLTLAANNFLSQPEFVTLYSANPSNADFVWLLYLHVHHRAPDAGGNQFWIDAMANKDGIYGHAWTRGEVLLAFSESAENVAALAGVMQNGITYTPLTT